MTNLDRLDILALAAEMGFHGTEGCCGSAALAINEVLFDNKGQIVMALNKAILRRDNDFLGHVGVLDNSGTIWDSDTVYIGKEGVEDFMEWGMLAPDDPNQGITKEEADDVDVFILKSLDEAVDIIGGTTCKHGDLAIILRTAMDTHFAGSN
jgi:hypothetical protein